MDVDGAAFPFDAACVRTRDAVDDFHQRTLAGSVLADHRMNLADIDAQVDTIVGEHGGVALGDAARNHARRGYRLRRLLVHVSSRRCPQISQTPSQVCGAASATGAASASGAEASSGAREPSCSNCAATAMAMAAGNLLIIPETPIGQVRPAGSMPSRRSRARKRAALLADPIRPTQAASPRLNIEQHNS